MVKSRKVAILATLLEPGKFCPEGRLGPPESGQKPGKAGKAGKVSFWPFLRVQGPLVKPDQGPIIGRYWAHSVPSPPSNMRGSQGSWSPGNAIASKLAPCSGPFQALHYAGLSGLLEP